MAQPQSASHRCSHCAREFARTEHLVRHERTHTKEKPFQCPNCGQSFSRRDLLRRHELKDHRPRASSMRLQAAEHSQSLAQNSTQLPLASSPSDSLSPQSNQTSGGLIASANDLLDDQGLLSIDQSRPQVFQNSELWNGSFIHQPIDIELQTSFSNGDSFFADDMSWMTSFAAASDISRFDFIPSDGLTATPIGHNSSVLSRPSSPLVAEEGDEVVSLPPRGRIFSMTEETRQRMQVEVSKHTTYILPPRMALSQYIQRYFSTFHMHMPFLHEATWSPQDAELSLVLAVCANGALYSLEREVALSLHESAVASMSLELPGICALQTTMLLSAFSAWSGDIQDLQVALQLRGGVTLILRREWSIATQDLSSCDSNWREWVAMESRKRVTCCLFTLFILMQVAYDIPSPLILDDQYGMPFQETQWRARTESEWIAVTARLGAQEIPTLNGIIQRLGDQSQPMPSNVGIFSCHVIISTLLQKIILFRQSCTSNDSGLPAFRNKYVEILRRWQTMWEQEPESSLAPDNPCGPMSFNATAILRLCYVRLTMDFSQIRRCFSFFNSANEIEGRIHTLEGPLRDSQTTRAALHACLALRIPVRLGFKVVTRTSFWGWSVQHALCYFECALLLAKWVQVIQHSLDLSEGESLVLKMVQDLVHASRDSNPDEVQNPLPAGVLFTWARLLDPGNTTVWQIQPKMAEVLKLHAGRLSVT